MFVGTEKRPDNPVCNFFLFYLQVLDVIIAAAAARGIYVLFDMHRVDAASPLPAFWCEQKH